MQVDFLLEGDSDRAALELLLPRLLPEGCVCRLKPFEGWKDLMGQLPKLLLGYRLRMKQAGQADLRVVVLMDADSTGSARLEDMERYAAEAGLLTRVAARAGQPFQVLNCLAVQELEAWFLGDKAAVAAAFPALKPTYFNRVGADSEALAKPSETLWHILKQGNYYQSGKQKTDWARAIAPHMHPARNTSPSFHYFCAGLAALR